MEVRMRMATWSIAALALAGCNGRGALRVGQGEEVDARLNSDVYTWNCASPDANWMGVFGFDIALEFKPDGLASRELPGQGECSYDLSMFAIDDLDLGEHIPGLDLDQLPRWRTTADDGLLPEVVEGLWYTSVFDNNRTCNNVGSIITSGVELERASILNGAITPSGGELNDVEVSSEYERGIPFGTDLDLSWSASGWQDSFVQIRRVRDGIAYEVVTCNTTGLDTFTVDGGVWGMFDDKLGVDFNYLYVGFRNRSEFETDYGQKVDVATRALHVVGIREVR